ncbi:unnamed protein product [Acanthoscelides obtectus]|nr:unnamed protein product [Acanthoscelides obtectus]CAK1637793.1 2-hydroxyacylsphingosine 1-beta-galactosyltransferase [Acanthoscelides obtectus]
MNFFDDGKKLSFGFMNIYKMVLQLTEDTLSYPEVQNLIKSGEKFDVVIVSQFMNEAHYMLAPHFNAHLIGLSTIGSSNWNNYLVGNPSLPSVDREMMLSHPRRMNFFQRSLNTLVSVINYLARTFYLLPNHAELTKKYISDKIDFEKELYNVSLVLLNSHPSVSDPKPHVPNMVEIGGFHIKEPKPLPEDLKKLLDGAKHGVIYFSMGSNIKSKDLPVEKRNVILKAFGKRKETILWKFEEDSLPGKPKNVIIRKWFPQQDILAHPKVKVFWTHGGLLSTTETVYHGVPILATPILGDQATNAQGAKDEGYGLILPYADIDENSLNGMLDELVSNPKYRKNVKTRSKIMRDRKVHPLDEAVYWVEYVIRHNGAKHLRMWYVEMPWYQYYLLDVIFAVFAVICLALYVIKKMCSLCCRRYKKTTSKKMKKN